MVTIDTEALPRRASDDWITKLIWGRFDNGQAGIRELVDCASEIGRPFVFFLDMAGAINNSAEYQEVARYLLRSEQDVEMHFHPETLPRKYWRSRGVEIKALRQDMFTQTQVDAILSHAALTFAAICGRTPRAYRAGSFRWNRATLHALKMLGIQYSFNSCREAAAQEGINTYASESSELFRWSNGIIEVPCGETGGGEEILHLRYPRKMPPGTRFFDAVRQAATGLSDDAVVVILLHSWSFLFRDQQSGHFYYGDQKHVDRFHRFLRQAAKEFDFIGMDELARHVSDRDLPVRSIDLVPFPQEMT